ncbi:MAG: oxygen-independent coproporphyrinogen III oxidase [Marivibrio sp.]|uniref:oxygen-independent coproporphyrinogen III oxidase n=1 Tax=Marivibrio sp. TaxID=2039719 RepID=UPI0032EC78E0
MTMQTAPAPAAAAPARAAEAPAGLLAKYGGPAPRYTSYPTAPHFDARVDGGVYANWLAQLPADQAVSIYAHIPFCDTLCWFCGCQTKITRRYKPVSEYLDVLETEIALIRRAIGDRRLPMSHMHWGGGSPTMLTPDDVRRLARALDAHFDRTADCVFAVEIDPREMSNADVDALAEAGVTRASLGLQDVDPKVQQAINRLQPMDETEALAARLRAVGVKELNLDLMYGLPYQSVEHVLRSVEAALTLRPDRIALFGYAHVPWMKTHQKMIPEEALPGGEERYAQAEAASAALDAAGYVRIGLDHFARPDDPMAIAHTAGTLKRNFQGYTTDDASALIGVGASAIGRLPQGYVQNESATGTYARMVAAGRLPVGRGKAFEGDDRLMGAAIERLMCDFEVDLDELAAEFAVGPEAFATAETRLVPLVADGLAERSGGLLRATPEGRPYIRHLAACFDHYFKDPARAGAARHSSAV